MHDSRLPAEAMDLLSKDSLAHEQLERAIREAVKRAVPLKPAEILAVLNTGAAFGERRLREGERVLKTRETPLLLAPREQYPEATRELERSLRLLVDEWLDTGFQNGCEYPDRRDLIRTRRALRAWIEYVRRYPPIPRDTNGAFHWFTMPPSALAGKDYPIHAAIEEAHRLFTGLMLADWRTSICKCRHPRCGKYFWIRTPQRAGYKHGTCEPQCRKRWSAERTVGADRANRTNRRISSAREAFEKYSRTHEGLALKQKIKEAVNRDRPHAEDGITVKWVTRNWATITSLGE